MRRPAAILILATLLAAVLATGPGAPAQASTRDERDKVRAQRAEAASTINALKASSAELEKALEALQANVATEESRLTDAQAAVDRLQAEVAQAQKGIESSTARLGGLRATMAEVAVNAYVEPEGSALGSVLSSGDASEATQRQAFRKLRADRDADIVDRIRAAKADLEARRRASARAQKRAEQKRAEVQNRLARVREAKAKQQTVVDGVQARIESEVGRAVELAKKDQALSAKIAQEQAALQARLLAAQAARRQAAANAAASAPAYGSGGSEGGGPVAGPGPAAPAGSGGGVSLCTVGGITVSCRISSQLGAMLSAAAGAGISLSGGGWRDPAQQIALRQQHCGSSYYAIYQMSASSCRPPTARPGQSMHEVGLAIDFENCGSRSTACYQWLAGNAGGFGFHNLPSEPWHWSINGN